MIKNPSAGSRLLHFFRSLGPGLVTGASDDDPSGIATYSQAGAQFGLATLWTALLTFPLMATVQEMCARIGMVTSQGLTTTLRSHYPKWILWIMILFSFPAVVLNIGADIAGMGAAANLVLPRIPPYVFTIGFTVMITAAIIYFPFQKIASVLKWLCITLLVYLAIPFFSHIDWAQVLVNTFVPHIAFTKDYISMIVAILGTTISPYLFFWQATMEAEDVKKKGKTIVVDKQMLTTMRNDVNGGMFFSNLVMFFVILTCGSVLYPNGIHQLTTIEQAAGALRPIAGEASYLLFALGIIGTGLLAIPVLTGSISYMIAETFGWQEGLDLNFLQAKPFYAVIIVSLLIGLVINYTGISPMDGLLYTAILYGVTSPVLIVIVLHIGNNQKIMGDRINKQRSNILGWITFALMTIGALLLLWFQFF